MSPATRAVINGNSHTAPNSRITSGKASPLFVRYEEKAKSPPRRSGRKWTATTKMIGTSVAAPRPRYVRFWNLSLVSSQR